MAMPGGAKRGYSSVDAVTVVRKVQKEPEDPFVPEIDMFPWKAWCILCPWKTTTGAWRDAYDMAFYHAKGDKHEEPKAALLRPSDASPSGEDASVGDPDRSGSDPGHGVSSGGAIRENTLTGPEIEWLDDEEKRMKEWVQENPEFRGRW
jgi:hypothetical protein